MKNFKYIISSVFALLLVSLIFNKPIAGAVERVTSVLVTNWPQLFNTQEQNLDTNGNIKVHEQGVVDVNITNPGSEVPPEAQIITVFDNIPMNDGLPKESEFIDLTGYKKVVLYVSKPEANSTTDVFGKFSLNDGVLYTGNPGFEIQLDSASHAQYKAGDVVGSQIKIILPNAQLPRPATISVKLYLIP